MLDSFIKGNMTALENKLMSLLNSNMQGAQGLPGDVDMGYVVICAAMVLFMQVRRMIRTEDTFRQCKILSPRARENKRLSADPAQSSGRDG